MKKVKTSLFSVLVVTCGMAFAGVVHCPSRAGATFKGVYIPGASGIARCEYSSQSGLSATRLSVSVKPAPKSKWTNNGSQQFCSGSTPSACPMVTAN